ncbi:MAG: EAL domain-containing protein [Nitrospirae bacterium]|nr:EAL domain-containing protein [Nitrospirota bacterium]
MSKPPSNKKIESKLDRQNIYLKWLPFLILFLSLVITFLAWNYTRKKIEQRTQSYFEQQAMRSQEEVIHGVEDYYQALYDLKGLFMATGNLTRAQWDKYIQSLDLKRRFPGMHNFSYARYVPKDQKIAYENRIRTELRQEAYKIYPPGNRDDYFPIEYLAFTYSENNDYGFDIGGDPVRREALIRAIQSGEPTATGKTFIRSANKSGFCIRIPIFKSGLPRRTEQERFNALQGIVSVVFSMDTFIKSVLENSSKKEIDLEIFDLGPAQSPRPIPVIQSDLDASLLYDGDGVVHFENANYNPSYRLTQQYDIAGEWWLFYLTAGPGFRIGSEHYFPFVVLIAGLLISGLFFGMTWTLVTSQKRAVKIAGAMTSELRESEEKFRSFTETASDAIITTDGEGQIIYANEGAMQLTGFSSGELVGTHFSNLIPERYRETRPGDFLKEMSLKTASRSGKSIEMVGLRKNQTEIPVELSLTRWKNEKGTFFTAIIRDITERKKTEQSLTQKNAFVQLLYVVTVAANESSTLEEALETCLSEICGHMNWSVGHVYFKSEDEGKSLFPSTIWHFDNPANYLEFKTESEMTFLKSGEGIPGMVLESGEPICLLITSGESESKRNRSAILSGIKSGFAIPLLVKDEVVAVLEFFSKRVVETDASTLEVMAHIGTQLGRVIERKKAKEELDFTATHDPLSHLPNRTLFSDRLEQAILNAKRNGSMAAVFFVDLDQFKRINDTLGHTLGDIALREVAKRLQDCVRAGDTVARWGGDEFTLLFENITKVDNLVRICHKVLDAISQPILIEEKELHLSTSIGITISPLDGDNAELLLKNADIAMYRAKEKGRNTFQFYSQEMSKDSSNKLELENQLRYAIERKEFILHYQPFVDLKTDKIVGAEALIRWNHPTLGMVPPGKFISLAEETGLIVQIGEWVLKTACEQNKAWQNMGLPPIRVAINLSARQFQRTGIVEMIKKSIQESGLSPRHLELELTESILMQKTDEMVSTLGELHQMGIHISLDDFGTGYSSLSYIKKFPIDTLKIDQSFVRDVITNKDDAALSTAIIAMAHSLNLKVIAEAVETAEQLEFFRSHGCNEIQGYYISPPLPPEVFKAFLHEKSLIKSI